MLGEGRPEEMLVGIVALVLALVVGWRIRTAMREGVVPLYKVRKSRSEMGEARFMTLVFLNVAAALLLTVIAADLILDLGLRG